MIGDETSGFGFWVRRSRRILWAGMERDFITGRGCPIEAFLIWIFDCHFLLRTYVNLS